MDDLLRAAMANDAKMVNELIAQGVDVNYAGAEGLTALHLASDPEIINTLIEANADVNAKAKKGGTALLLACAEGNYEKAKKLMEYPNTNIDLPEENGITPLMVAAQRGASDILKELIAHNANTGAKDLMGNNALHCVITREDLEILLNHDDTLLNDCNKQKVIPLAMVATNLTELFKSPPQKQSHVNPIAYDIDQKIEIIKLFIESGAIDNIYYNLIAWTRQFPYPVKPILAIPEKVTKLLENPILNKSILASDNPEIDELLRKNLSSRVAKLSEQKSLSSEQIAQLIVVISPIKIAVPEEIEQDVAKFVVENLQKHGVPAESVPEYLNIMSNNYPFLETIIKEVLKSEEVVKDGATILQHLTLLLTDPKLIDPEAKKAPPELAQVNRIFFGLYNQIHPHPKTQGQFTDELKNELKKYQDDPSLFLAPILQNLDILVYRLKKEVIIGNIANKDIRDDIKGLKSILHLNGKPFQYLGTTSQVKQLQKRMEDIATLSQKVAEYEYDKYDKYYHIATSPIPEEIAALKNPLKKYMSYEDLPTKTSSPVKSPTAIKSTKRERSNSMI